MFKILGTADWHLGDFKGPVEDNRNLRSEDTVNCLKSMVDTAKLEKPDLVCVSGDIFHQEQVGPARYTKEVLAATDIITDLSKITKHVIVMRGTPNHDGKNQFKVLKKMLEHISNVDVITEPSVIRTPVADIACIPGFDKQEFRAKFPGLSAEEENLAWTKYISDLVMGLRAKCHGTPILMAHYTVPGCNMESGQTSFFSNFEPVIPREALQAAGYEAVFLGHIHRPQKLAGLKHSYYMGAINAFNFNDECQKRGFWIFEFDNGCLCRSQFHETPYRQFCTVDWEPEDVRDYLSDGKMALLGAGMQEEIADAIVRIRYSCTAEQKKQLNIPLLQKDLYDIGAFYVADIEAESMVDITNRGLLSEESDPLLNLKKWLDEKCARDTDKIVEMAEPIIASAMRQSGTAEIHGIFRPVSISVRNYRNYKEESFDFSDVSFCTINGVNGAGKSSLFMDAIVDCLFEETREGDNKAWIRGTEDARSGSIEFIFDIGDSRFRVVRTRTKSGKPTLNLSRLGENGNEWLNLSKERIFDTQAEIERILGMDSMTFRSCALIMQDQYGLFLQARKEERISILGNLLGLGIYGVMEQDARKKLGDQKRLLASKKEAVTVKEDFIRSKGDPAAELAEVKEETAAFQAANESLEQERQKLLLDQDAYQTAVEKREAAKKALAENTAKQAELALYINETLKIISDCDALLNGDAVSLIRKNAARYREASEQVTALTADIAVYQSEQEKAADCNRRLRSCQEMKKDYENRNRKIAAEIAQLQPAEASDIDGKLAELEKAQEALSSEKEKKDRVSAIRQEKSDAYAVYLTERNSLISQVERAEKDLAAYTEQKAYMKNSGCPDIEKASCRFLQKAVSDVAKIPDTEAGLKILRSALAEKEQEWHDLEAGYKADETAVGYNPGELERLTALIASLVPYRDIKKRQEAQKLQIARLEVEKASNDKNIAQCVEQALQLIPEAQEATEKVNSLSVSVEKYNAAKKDQMELLPYQTQEQELPVYEERRRNAQEKLEGFFRDKEILAGKSCSLVGELSAADAAVKAADRDAGAKLSEVSGKIAENQGRIGKLQMTAGSLLQKIEDVKQLSAEISGLKKEIETAAQMAYRYGMLKEAFSQDGVPHQVIRNIVPHITDTANNILGSMTGGTMGVEFVMERTVKGKDGDKATLDVLIDEYGKTTLPYASKSGGEKVKASLAVILALSEIKATAAGIQLGMLFIDEPPFLDDDGAQAYVDALEAIRRRYPDVKVMAITHDDAMKARFAQSVTVIKTDEGSKVIY